MTSVVAVLLLSAIAISAIPLDNGVVGGPEIECGSSMIGKI